MERWLIKKLANTVRYKNKRASYLEYKTIDDIQKFIDTHQDITNPKIFRLQYSGLYDIACSLGIILDNLNTENLLR